MRFNPKARLDPSQVTRRGGSGGSGMPGGRRRGGKVAGGGIGGLLLVLLFYIVTQVLGGGSGGGGTSATGFPFDLNQVSGSDAGVDLSGQCQTGEDANNNPDCAMVATVNTIQAFWEQALPDQSGTSYELSVTNLFTDQVQTGCGGATSQVGPFYCPVDDSIYLDLTFFDVMLEGQLGAEGGPFAQAYVVAHEYGHHIQDLTGTMNQVQTRQGEQSDAVRLELQADCYAGMWTKYATTVEDADGNVFIEELTDEDINNAIDAAETVGDDRIQSKTQGQVNPETWTHGSAEMRKRWFLVGMEEGSMEACDTFAVDRV